MAPNKRTLKYLFTLFCVAIPVNSWAQSYTLTTFAGADHFGDGKQATAVPLRDPYAAVQDAAGNIYITDRDDQRIRKVSPTGVISTFAGTGRPGFNGDGGPAIAAALRSPSSLVLDTAGNLFFVDYSNFRVRRINLTTGIITTVAGDGTLGYGGENVQATRSGMTPTDVAVDADGNVYIADAFNHRVRRVNTGLGTIQTIAGIGNPGFSGDGASALTAALNFPWGVGLDAQKNVYIADYSNSRVRKVTVATGIITTIAGTGVADIRGNGGLATSAAILYPHGVVIEGNGNILIAGDYDVRRITLATGIIRNVAPYFSDFGFAGDGGGADVAIWSTVNGVSVAQNGDILVADTTNYRIRRIRSGIVTTVAGIGLVNDVAASQAFLSNPGGMAFSATGGLMFADTSFNQVRSVEAGRVGKIFGDGYATSSLARVSGPQGVARDRLGNTYIADSLNDRILRIFPNGAANVFAGGRGRGFNGNFGTATTLALALPQAVIVDADGAVYIADYGNCRVRRVVEGLMNTIAGGSCTYSGDNGQAASAGLIPWDIVLDGRGGLVIATGSNHRIRRRDLTTGIITTIAGIGTAGHSGDGGPATQAQVGDPRGVTVDSAGRIFFTEYLTAQVRMIDTNGVIRTIAGTGAFISSAESGPAASVAFDPVRILAAADGSLYVSDQYNDRIRKLTVAVPTALQVTQGAGASGPAGSKIPVQVKVVDASGVAIANQTVRFQVTSGTAQLSSVSTVTTAAGIAQIEVTLGSTLGPVVITASTDGLPSVTINLTITAPTGSLPQLSEAAVVGAGLSVPSVRALSTGGIMSAFGQNFGVGATFRKVGAADLVNGKVPTNCVDIAGSRAPVFGASDTQINFQVPAGLSGNVPVKVLTGCATATETATNAISVPVQAASPEFFYFAFATTGKNPVAATDTITGALLASPTLFPGSGIGAAKPGSFVTVYATGFGDTDPSFTPGDFPAGIGRAKGTVRVLLDGAPLPAANILYAGVTPNSPGLYQLNIQLPANAATGDLSLVIEIGGIQSPAGGFLTVAP